MILWMHFYVEGNFVLDDVLVIILEGIQVTLLILHIDFCLRFGPCHDWTEQMQPLLFSNFMLRQDTLSLHHSTTNTCKIWPRAGATLFVIQICNKFAKRKVNKVKRIMVIVDSILLNSSIWGSEVKVSGYVLNVETWKCKVKFNFSKNFYSNVWLDGK